jgi:hypothetical protein
MPLPANLFWTHSQGDPTTLPCTHIVQQHPNGDPYNAPCTHFVQEHPGGHPNPIPGLPNLPCTHVRQQHPSGDIFTTPCIHFVQQHPGGHAGPEIPCLHPMPVMREVPSLNLKFYTGDTTIQKETIAAAQRLKNLGISIGTFIRPLSVFNRGPVNGNPDDPTDPFWSHYNPLFHSIQITRRPGPLDVNAMRDTLHHEMGHATLGHSLVQVSSPGQPHTLTGPTDPAEAMSEGWAHFIALVIRFPRTEVNPSYKGMFWGTRNTTVACSPNIEYNVGCCLWDLFDVPNDGITPLRPAPDTVILPLSELFRVYSPTLTTILNGPIIPSVGNYLERLENNNPSLRLRIERVRRMNCC